MDRNRACTTTITICIAVALRKESVDRNCVVFSSGANADRSLSARRAWIEIFPPIELCREQEAVALRKESVDRNYKERPGQKARPVALRKESVDRNDRLRY